MNNIIKHDEKKRNGVLKISFSGRLDAQGATTLEHDLNDCLHRGEHHILLNLDESEYLSSAGIRVLIMFRKKLSAIDGSFSVTVSDKGNIRQVLELSGLTMLIADDSTSPVEHKKQLESFTKDDINFEIMDRQQGGFTADVIGSSNKLISGSFTKEDACDCQFPDNSLALGIGALGHGFDNCCNQFGEFLALGGAALTRPPGSSEVDYSITHEKIVPEGCLLSGLRLDGNFDTVFRFFPNVDLTPIPLSMLCQEALNMSKSDGITMVAAVEVADLVGAAIAKSPAEKSADENIFSFPQIRNWLTFTGEPVHKGTTALLAGVVFNNKDVLKGNMLKPVGENLFGMFKAGVFSYSPLSQDQTDLTAMTHDIFERHKLVDLLHLINDQRTLLGVGESHFLRGTVWIGNINKDKS